MFDKINSLDEVYDSDCEADLNHVFLVLDGKYFDGNGEADPSEWYGKLFLKDDSIDGFGTYTDTPRDKAVQRRYAGFAVLIWFFRGRVVHRIYV